MTKLENEDQGINIGFFSPDYCIHSSFGISFNAEFADEEWIVRR